MCRVNKANGPLGGPSIQYIWKSSWIPDLNSLRKNVREKCPELAGPLPDLWNSKEKWIRDLLLQFFKELREVPPMYCHLVWGHTPRTHFPFRGTWRMRKRENARRWRTRNYGSQDAEIVTTSWEQPLSVMCVIYKTLTKGNLSGITKRTTTPSFASGDPAWIPFGAKEAAQFLPTWKDWYWTPLWVQEF